MNGHLGKLLDFSESRWLTFKIEKKIILEFYSPFCFCSFPIKQLKMTLMRKKKQKEDFGGRADLIWNQTIFFSYVLSNEFCV